MAQSLFIHEQTQWDCTFMWSFNFGSDIHEKFHSVEFKQKLLSDSFDGPIGTKWGLPTPNDQMTTLADSMIPRYNLIGIELILKWNETNTFNAGISTHNQSWKDLFRVIIHLVKCHLECRDKSPLSLKTISWILNILIKPIYPRISRLDNWHWIALKISIYLGNIVLSGS